MKDKKLEPGQDDLIREGGGFRRGARGISLSGVSKDEQIYTDHDAGNAASLTPSAEMDRALEERSQSPFGKSAGQVAGGALARLGRAIKGLFSSRR